ncbi:MAG: hypothetical protein KDA65_07200 [Planctomycetaceae bacterium]|nr:hypothetical protein [Planctomycetaceae bacterium]
MTDYTLIHEYIRKYPNDFKINPIASEKTDQLVQEYPDVPQDYLDFVRQFGAMMIGNSGYMLYGRFTDPHKIFDPGVRAFPDVVLIGDDFAGASLGYRINKQCSLNSPVWELIEISCENYEVEPAYLFDDDDLNDAENFKDWIDSYIKYWFSDC